MPTEPAVLALGQQYWHWASSTGTGPAVLALRYRYLCRARVAVAPAPTTRQQVHELRESPALAARSLGTNTLLLRAPQARESTPEPTGTRTNSTSYSSITTISTLIFQVLIVQSVLNIVAPAVLVVVAPAVLASTLRALLQHALAMHAQDSPPDRTIMRSASRAHPYSFSS